MHCEAALAYTTTAGTQGCKKEIKFAELLYSYTKGELGPPASVVLNEEFSFVYKKVSRFGESLPSLILPRHTADDRGGGG